MLVAIVFSHATIFIMFLRNGNYEHSNPNASLFIKVLSIIHLSEEYIKMKVSYFHKHNGRIQYTGIGQSEHTDTIKIQRSDFKYWKEVKDEK